MILLHLHDRILLQWQKIPLSWRLELTSAFYTFATASLLEAGIQYHLNGNVLPSDLGLALAALAACARAGVKAVGRLVYVKLSAYFAAKRAEKTKYE